MALLSPLLGLFDEQTNEQNMERIHSNTFLTTVRYDIESVSDGSIV